MFIDIVIIIIPATWKVVCTQSML